jgi:methionyl-tRNA synthetase
MMNAPESTDSPFTWEDFRHGVNADLANVFGNFINRVTRFTQSRFEGRVPEGGLLGMVERQLYDELDRRLELLTQHHEAMEFRKAAAETRAIWVRGNEYLQAAAPWSVMKEDASAAAISVRVGLNLCVLFATIAMPFIPDAAETVFRAFDIQTPPQWPDGLSGVLLNRLPVNSSIRSPDLLFRKIEETELAAWRERFGH